MRAMAQDHDPVGGQARFQYSGLCVFKSGRRKMDLVLLRLILDTWLLLHDRGLRATDQ